MNKNAANIYRFVIVDIIGQGLTGLTPSITLAKDSATTFTAATNTPSEVSATDAPGLYEIELTATECNCDTLTIRVTLPTGQAPAILDVVQMQGASGGGATPQEIWEYTGGRTVTNTIPTAADNATAVWGASSRTLTNLNIQSELTTYGAAKTTDLTGLATSQDITNSQAVIIGAMPTTAGLATSADVTTAQAEIIAAMPDVSGLATSSDLADVATTANEIKAKTDALPAVPAAKSDIPTAGDNASSVWNADVRSLTTEIEVEISADDISDIAAGVWNHTPRTLSGDPSSTVVYCNTAMLYAHWTQDKIDAWANGSQDAIDAAIVSASRKIDADLDQAVSTPFQPVPADIRDLAILAAGVILARQAGDTDDPSVTAAESYYVKFVEDYNYTADN